jgi:signal transduction histidine kinase
MLAEARDDWTEDGGRRWPGAVMTESERLGKLRHDLSNPLSALLAEIQLLLLNESQIDPETLSSLRDIEALAIRMRAMLREI